MRRTTCGHNRDGSRIAWDGMWVQMRHLAFQSGGMSILSILRDVRGGENDVGRGEGIGLALEPVEAI